LDCYLATDDNDYDAMTSLVIFSKDDSVLLNSVTHSNRSPSSVYEQESDFLVLGPELLLDHGYKKSEVLSEFNMIIEMLRCNRENCVILYCFLRFYSRSNFVEEPSTIIFDEVLNFENVEDFHTFCDDFEREYSFEALFEICRERIRSIED